MDSNSSFKEEILQLQLECYLAFNQIAYANQETPAYLLSDAFSIYKKYMENNISILKWTLIPKLIFSAVLKCSI